MTFYVDGSWPLQDLQKESDRVYPAMPPVEEENSADESDNGLAHVAENCDGDVEGAEALRLASRQGLVEDEVLGSSGQDGDTLVCIEDSPDTKRAGAGSSGPDVIRSLKSGMLDSLLEAAERKYVATTASASMPAAKRLGSLCMWFIVCWMDVSEISI